MRRRAGWFGTALLIALASASPARADTVERFDPFVQKPATSPLGLFTLEGAAAGDGVRLGRRRRRAAPRFQ